LIVVNKIYEWAYWASFVSKDVPADYRSSKLLSADEVIAELTQWGADIVEIKAALEAADEKWNLQKNATGGNLRFMDWKCLRWETPISDAKSLMMELLQVRGKVEIILDSSNIFHSSPNVKIIFSQSEAFRSLQESYMSTLWGTFAKTASPGRTFIVEDSPWISELAEQDSLFAHLSKDACHYVIATDAEVIEVISRYPPSTETA
jgi:hypothetical protein